MSFVGGILCGGLGKRLRPLTDVIPKVLLELKEGYTVLDHQLNKLKHAGINIVYILAGYLHDKIEGRYGNNWSGVKLEYLIEDRARGTLYAINNLLSVMNEGEKAVVLNGDVVSDVNLREMVRCWKEGTGSIFLTSMTSPYGIVEVGSEGRIVSFKEKPKLPYYVNGGIYVIPKSLEAYFKEHREGEVEELVFPPLARDGLLNSYIEADVFWQSLDSFKDLERVRYEYRNKHDAPWGYEREIVSTESYVVKTLFIMKGFPTPSQVHKAKDETIHVAKGRG